MIPQRLRRQFPGERRDHYRNILHRTRIHHDLAELWPQTLFCPLQHIKQQRTHIGPHGADDALAAVFMPMARVGRQTEQGGIAIERQQPAGLGDQRNSDGFNA